MDGIKLERKISDTREENVVQTDKSDAMFYLAEKHTLSYMSSSIYSFLFLFKFVFISLLNVRTFCGANEFTDK